MVSEAMPAQSSRQSAYNAALAKRADRDAARIVKLKASGLSHAQIAERVGISRARVGQILKRAQERGLKQMPAKG